MRKTYLLKTAYIILCTTAFAITDNVLAQDAQDTIVEIAYSRQPEWKRTGALSTVKGEELMNTIAPTMGNTLQGRLPGLTILQQSGEPGYDFDIGNFNARGSSSYTDDQNILVFVDGFEAPLERLVATEIESISLLKDASALAMYGMRGANGVLLVTTKKGTVGAPKIDARVQTGIQQPMFSTEPIGAYDYAWLYNRARINDGLEPLYTANDLQLYLNGEDPFFRPNVNWKNEVMRNTAPLRLAELNFRGGSDVARYYVMMNVLQNEGFYSGTDRKREENSNAYYASYNFRSNLDVNITEKLLSSLYFSGSVGDRSVPGGGSSAWQVMRSVWHTPPNAFPVINPDGSYGGSNLFTNPVGDILERGLYKENSRTFQLIFNLKYSFDRMLEGLSVNGAVAYNNYMADSSPKNANYARYALGRASNDDIVYTQYGVDLPLEASEGFTADWSRTNVKFQLDYNREFGLHGVDFNGFFLTDIYEAYGVRDNVKYINYAGRLTYNYDKRYIAELTSAYTGSDNFAPGNRYGFFPAVSAGWVVSNEDFAQSLNNLNYLKLRTSYGIVGNNQMGAGRFLFDQTYSGRGSYLFGTGSAASNGFAANMLAVSGIAWENKSIFNLGFDATLFNDLSLSVDYFQEERRDILTQPNAIIPGFVGASSGNIMPYMNVGSVKNSGFEASLRYHKQANETFRYFIEPSVWYARNIIQDMAEQVRVYDYLYRKGHPVGTPFVLVADGLYQESDFDATGNLNSGLPVPQFGGAVQPGDIKYVDQNGDNIIDANDVYPVGYGNVPQWNYALRLGFDWKGFNMEALLHGVANRDVFLSGPLRESFMDNGTASVLALDSWRPANPTGSYPRLSTTTFEHNYRGSTFWMRSGDYLRLRNLHLGYTLPESWSSGVGLDRIYVYAQGVNLFTADGLDGLADPENPSLLTYPLAKSYNLGLKIDF